MISEGYFGFQSKLQYLHLRDKYILEDDVDLYENFYDDFIPNYNNSKQNLEIICKATDVCYNTQQKTLEDAWNLRGLNNNSYHKFIYKL